MERRAKRDGRGAAARRMASALALAGAIGLAAGAMPPRQEEAPVEATRSALDRWVEVRRILSQEKRDWEIGRELLTDRIAVVQREIDALRERIGETRGTTVEQERERADLGVERDRLRETQARMTEAVQAFEARARDLLARLPDPLRQDDGIQLLSQRLPEDSHGTKLGLGDRFLNVVGVLNQIDKFQREITVSSEVQKLQDGTSVEVTALYLGLGQAYYVNGDQTLAGVGTPGPSGWTWQPANDAAPAIARAVKVFQNEEPAAYVPLPVRVD